MLAAQSAYDGNGNFQRKGHKNQRSGGRTIEPAGHSVTLGGERGTSKRMFLTGAWGIKNIGVWESPKSMEICYLNSLETQMF